MKNKPNKKGLVLMVIFIMVFVGVMTIFIFFAFAKYHLSVFAIDRFSFEYYQPLSLVVYPSVTTVENSKVGTVFVLDSIYHKLRNVDSLKSYEDSLKTNGVLPSNCYKFSIKGEVIFKNEIGCKSDEKLFTSKYPLPVFVSGAPQLTDFEISVSKTSGVGLERGWPAR